MQQEQIVYATISNVRSNYQIANPGDTKIRKITIQCRLIVPVNRHYQNNILTLKTEEIFLLASICCIKCQTVKLLILSGSETCCSCLFCVWTLLCFLGTTFVLFFDDFWGACDGMSHHCVQLFGMASVKDCNREVWISINFHCNHFA